MQILLIQRKAVAATVYFNKLCMTIYVQLSYVQLGELSVLPDDHTQDIGIFGPYVQIYDE